MTHSVTIADAALQDLYDIHDYLFEVEGPDRALAIVEQLEKQISTLSVLPARGNIPKELAENGQTSFRELHYKPYRIFYSIYEETVTVLLVADGRRDMQTLLRQRLLKD